MQRISPHSTLLTTLPPEQVSAAACSPDRPIHNVCSYCPLLVLSTIPTMP
jgi:hypothetical protein